MAQGSQTSRRQIIGMNVIGIDIIAVNQRGQAFLQPFDWQAVMGVNTRYTQDADRHGIARAPIAQTTLGIDPAFGARVVGLQSSGFVNPLPLTIAINPCRTYVNQSSW